MMRAFLAFGAAWILMLVACPKPAAAQTGKLNQDLLKDWTDMKEMLIKIANQMPEEKYSFKATPAERDFGQQVLHVAQANVLNLAHLQGKAKPPVVNRNLTGKAEIIKTMSDTFDYGSALIREQTDQSMLETVQGGLGPSSRARIVYYLLGHCWDVYGQMVVYLRLNGIVPVTSSPL